MGQDSHIQYFNSTIVRLRVGFIAVLLMPAEFQFYDSMIKRAALLVALDALL